MNRRNFLKTGIALFAAPSIVKAENIMDIFTPSRRIIIPEPMAYSASRIAHEEFIRFQNRVCSDIARAMNLSYAEFVANYEFSQFPGPDAKREVYGVKRKR